MLFESVAAFGSNVRFFCVLFFFLLVWLVSLCRSANLLNRSFSRSVYILEKKKTEHYLHYLAKNMSPSLSLRGRSLT